MVVESLAAPSKIAQTICPSLNSAPPKQICFELPLHPSCSNLLEITFESAFIQQEYIFMGD
jgi:hypothetical protein